MMLGLIESGPSFIILSFELLYVNAPHFGQKYSLNVLMNYALLMTSNEMCNTDNAP